MKKSIISITAILLLASCKTNLISPPKTKEVLNYEFGGMFNQEFEMFYQKGWMAAECKFDDLDLRLINDAGFLRTPSLDITKDKIYIYMTSHFTGLNNLNETAIGKRTKLVVYGLDEEGSTIASEEYTHTLTNEDIANQSFNDFPAYSSDFSKSPYFVTLTGNGIKKIKIELAEKISFTGSNGKKEGCNFAIKNLTIKEAL